MPLIICAVVDLIASKLFYSSQSLCDGDLAHCAAPES